MVSSQINMHKETKTMLVSFFTNLCLSSIKIITGIIGKSNAIIVDGIHSFSDLTTDVIAIIGNIMSKKPADIKHPYGHGKIEYITSFIIGIIIVLLGLGVIKNLGETKNLNPSIIVLYVTIFTIISKFILASYLINRGNKMNNTIIIASGQESKTDVITSIIVLFSSLLSQFDHQYYFIKYIDKFAGILIALFIIKIGMKIIKDNISYILGESNCDDKYNNDIKNIILNSENVYSVNNLIILKYGPYYKLTADVLMSGNIDLTKAHQEIDKIEHNIKIYDKKISYIIIHMCPEEKTIDTAQDKC
ncbi:MAG: cation diffusion facilitator family transporter [Bacilli bacterium]|nr:cation diffusion facilitator family transporter [Bacilli bacterium]